MKKILLPVLLLCILLSVCLSGCGETNGKTNETTEMTEETSAPETKEVVTGEEKGNSSIDKKRSEETLTPEETKEPGETKEPEESEEISASFLKSLLTEEYTILIPEVKISMSDATFTFKDGEMALWFDENQRLVGNASVRVGLLGNLNYSYQLIAELENGVLYYTLPGDDGELQTTAVSAEYLIKKMTGESISFRSVEELLWNLKTEGMTELLNAVAEYQGIEKTESEILDSLVGMLFDVNKTETSVTYSLSKVKLGVLIQNIKTLTVAQWVDLLLGDGSYQAYKDYLYAFDKLTMGEVKEQAEQNGTDMQEVLGLFEMMSESIPGITLPEGTMGSASDLLSNQEFLSKKVDEVFADMMGMEVTWKELLDNVFGMLEGEDATIWNLISSFLADAETEGEIIDGETTAEETIGKELFDISMYAGLLNNLPTVSVTFEKDSLTISFAWSGNNVLTYTSDSVSGTIQLKKGRNLKETYGVSSALARKIADRKTVADMLVQYLTISGITEDMYALSYDEEGNLISVYIIPTSLTIPCTEWILTEVKEDCSGYYYVYLTFNNDQEDFDAEVEAYYNPETRGISFDSMHDYVLDETRSSSATDCAHPGKTVTVCSKCGDEIVTVAQIAHQLTEESTQTTEGELTVVTTKTVCTACGYLSTEEIGKYNADDVCVYGEYASYDEDGNLTVRQWICNDALGRTVEEGYQFGDYWQKTEYTYGAGCARTEHVTTSLGDDETTEGFYHANTETKYELAPGALSCEEGVIVSEICTDCGAIEEQYTTYSHADTEYEQYTVGETTVGERAVCPVCGQTLYCYVDYWSDPIETDFGDICSIGEDFYYAIVMTETALGNCRFQLSETYYFGISYNAETGEYDLSVADTVWENEDCGTVEKHQYSNTYTEETEGELLVVTEVNVCSVCGLKVCVVTKTDADENTVYYEDTECDADGNILQSDKTWYDEEGRSARTYCLDENGYWEECEYTYGENCMVTVHFLSSKGEDKTESYENHSHQETRYELMEGSVSCEDGVWCIIYCADCGEEIWRSQGESHFTMDDDVVLTGFSDTCETILRHSYCACGACDSYQVLHGVEDCKLIKMADLEDGDGCAMIYGCDFSLPTPCNFRYAIVFFKEKTGCVETNYCKIYIGFDGEDWQSATYVTEAFDTDISDCHDYEGVILSYENNTRVTSYQCTECGYVYCQKTEKTDENGNIIDCLIEYTNGETEEEITEWQFVSDEWVVKTRLNTFTDEDGVESWEKYTYTYSAENPCVCTIIREDNDGNRDEWEESSHSFANETASEGTCTRQTVIRQYCLVCGYETFYTIDDAGHSYQYVEASDSYVCTVCGMTSKTGESEKIILEELENHEISYFNQVNYDYYCGYDELFTFDYILTLVDANGEQLATLNAKPTQEDTENIYGTFTVDLIAVRTEIQEWLRQNETVESVYLKFVIVPSVESTEEPEYAVTFEEAYTQGEKGVQNGGANTETGWGKLIPIN